MHDMPQVPERVRSVIEEYCRRKCGEAETAAYARGVAAGKEEILAVLKAVSAFQPSVYAPVNPTAVASFPQLTANPVVATEVHKVEPVKAPIPEALLSRPVAAVIADMEDGEELGTAGFRDALDDLFGDERWGDLDRQELVRYVMLMVQEELAERGVDPSPVLSMVRTLGECGGGQPFEATLLSLTDPTLLSWQAVPLRNPRGNFRFAAENLETGQKRYGEKAIAHMQHANKDRHEFAEGERQPYDLKGKRTLMEHTEAFRKAKDSLSELVESLRAGESVRPGDLADFQDRIGLLPVSDLRTLRKQLSNSLTSRVKAGKTKADRVAGIQESLGRLVEAATAITKAALDRAEMDGATVHPPDDMMETLLEGEIIVNEPLPDEVHLSVAPNSPKPPKKVEPPKPAGPKAGAYQASPPTPAPPKPPEQKKPAAPPKPPAYSDYGVGGQKMEGARTPGAPTVAEVQAKSGEKDAPKANAPAPKPGKPQEVPRPQRPLASPMERTASGLAVPSETAPKPNIGDDSEVIGKLHPAEQQEIDDENADFLSPQSRAAFQSGLDEYQGVDAQAAFDEYDAANAEGRRVVDPVFNDWNTFVSEPGNPTVSGRLARGPFRGRFLTPSDELAFAEQVPTDAGRRGLAKRVTMDLTGNADPERRSLFERAWADAEAGRMNSPAVVELMQMPDDGRPETALAKQLTTAAFSPEDLSNAFSAWNSVYGADRGMNAMFGQFVPPAGVPEAQTTDGVRGLIDYFQKTGDRSVLPILADAYEEAGVDANDLYVMRNRPHLIHEGMWAVTPQPLLQPEPPPPPGPAAPSDAEKEILDLWDGPKPTRVNGQLVDNPSDYDDLFEDARTANLSASVVKPSAKPSGRKPIRVAGWGL